MVMHTVLHWNLGRQTDFISSGRLSRQLDVGADGTGAGTEKEADGLCLKPHHQRTWAEVARPAPTDHQR